MQNCLNKPAAAGFFVPVECSMTALSQQAKPKERRSLSAFRNVTTCHHNCGNGLWPAHKNIIVDKIRYHQLLPLVGFENGCQI